MTIRAPAACARMMRIEIGDGDVWTLRNRHVGVAEWCLERSKRSIARRTEHAHAVSEKQLRMSHSAVVGGHRQMPLETERRAEPLDRGISVSVSQWRNRIRSRLFGAVVHAPLLGFVLGEPRWDSSLDGSYSEIARPRGTVSERVIPENLFYVGYPATGLCILSSATFVGEE